METKQVRFTLNGKQAQYDTPVNWTLLRLLREGFGLTGTKSSCEEGECGSCTVLMDGKAVASCLVLAPDCDGREVRTIEGLEVGGKPDPLQQAFVDKGAVQCGYCTPGMIMAGKALLAEYPHPTPEDIKKGMSGNLCRCTGYEKIAEAITAVANGEYN